MNIDTRLAELGDRLERSVAADLRTERRADGSVTTRARRTRPRLLAGSTLGLAGVGAALVVALGSSATTPAFAVTQQGNGSVTVQINSASGIVGANRRLAAMGTHEGILYRVAPGAAPTAGPVTCTPSPSDTHVPRTPVSAYLGADNSENVPSGDTGAGGVEHLTSCTIYNGTPKIGSYGHDGHPAVSVTLG